MNTIFVCNINYYRPNHKNIVNTACKRKSNLKIHSLTKTKYLQETVVRLLSLEKNRVVL